MLKDLEFPVNVIGSSQQYCGCLEIHLQGQYVYYIGLVAKLIFIEVRIKKIKFKKLRTQPFRMLF